MSEVTVSNPNVAQNSAVIHSYTPAGRIAGHRIDGKKERCPKQLLFDTASRSGDGLWNLVRSHSLNKRTFRPMICWPYSFGGAATNPLDDSSVRVAASYCCTILGWDYHCGKKYLILRKPCNTTEAALNVENHEVSVYDMSWWPPLDLPTMDGVFAMEANTFQQYYAGLGVVV